MSKVSLVSRIESAARLATQGEWDPPWTPSIRRLFVQVGVAHRGANTGWCRTGYGLLHPMWHSETWTTHEQAAKMQRYWTTALAALESP